MIKNLKFYKRRRDALIKQLKTIGSLISGSVVYGEWKCNMPGCRCKNGRLHMACTLTWKEDKKTKTLYIPVELRGEVIAWNEEYKRVKDIIEGISEYNRIIIRGYVKEKRGRKRHT